MHEQNILMCVYVTRLGCGLLNLVLDEGRALVGSKRPGLGPKSLLYDVLPQEYDLQIPPDLGNTFLISSEDSCTCFVCSLASRADKLRSLVGGAASPEDVSRAVALFARLITLSPPLMIMVSKIRYYCSF